jgi:DNA-binding beta-propeller fold protein YncE
MRQGFPEHPDTRVPKPEASGWGSATTWDRSVVALSLVMWLCQTAGADCWYFDQQWPTEGRPVSVAADGAGHVYVLCHDTEFSVQEYNIAGRLLARWGKRGSGPGQLLAPQGIAVDKSGHVYVADTGNQRIQKFRGNGRFVKQWRTYARSGVRTFRPFGIATEISGQYVYVTDDAHSRVLKFTTGGFPVRQWGSYGTGDGQFGAPRHIATDSRGFVYVVDNAGNSVKKFTQLGVFENVWGGPEGENSCFVGPFGIAVDYSGYLWVTDKMNRVQQFRQPVQRQGWFGGCDDAEHAQAGCWHEFFSTHLPAAGTNAGQFAEPQGLATDLAGNLYVADFANHRIQKLASLNTSGLAPAGAAR